MTKQLTTGVSEMTSPTAAIPTPISRPETGALLGQTMGLVAFTAGLFALGAYIGRNASGGWAIGSFIAAFAVLLGINAVAQRSEQLAVGLLFGFGLLLGLAVAPTISHYANADPQAVWEAGGATALFVAGFGVVGYATRRDLSKLARTAFWALLALIVFGIVLVFVHIPGGALIYSIAGLVIFAGLTLFDFQRLRQTEDIRTAPVMAASIFLDALNVFLLFLSIFDRNN
jgi:FtsH-binding integral membrane protein